MDLITTERVLVLHGAGISEHGGETASPNIKCVQGAVGNAHQAALYGSDYDEPDPLRVACLLCRSLVQNHCFIDGNKRVGWLSLGEVLLVSVGLMVAADDDVAEAFMEDVATGTADVGTMLSWLAEPGRLVAAE